MKSEEIKSSIITLWMAVPMEIAYFPDPRNFEMIREGILFLARFLNVFQLPGVFLGGSGWLRACNS